MSDDAIFFLAAFPMVATIIGGVIIIVLAMKQRGITMELRHRERMAMIERGLTPGPATDPAAFDRVQQLRDHSPARATSIGVVIVALGLGLMLMIGFAGEAPGSAVGIGGSIIVLGLAFIVNGELSRRREPPVSSQPRGFSAPPPVGRSDPPGTVGP